jgi:hypothetical protein
MKDFIKKHLLFRFLAIIVYAPLVYYFGFEVAILVAIVELHKDLIDSYSVHK